MLKTCKYCGIVPYNHICPHKEKHKKSVTNVDRFRWSRIWQEKREEIKQRDLYLCQICIREIFGTTIKYNSNNLSVHHNIPINEDYNRRLDNNNLITLCSMHHEMCENGEIPRKEVQEIINEQEKRVSPPPITKK